MWRFIGQRLVGTIPVLLGITVLVFLILYLMPGSPAQTLLFGKQATPEQVAELNHQLGLDRPLAVQYFSYLGDVVQGNLGTSYATQRAVSSEITSQFPSTMLLALAGMAVALLIGIPAGVLAALKRGSWIDSFATGFSVLGVAIPNYWLAILLMLLFSVQLHWFPVLGQGSLRAIVLPAISLGWGFASIITRLVRANMIEVLQQPYVTTARAKGLRETSIVFRHALRNAFIPVLTIIGLQIANLLSGAVVIESIFARQGIGALAVRAIQSKDIPLVQGVVIVVALIYVVINLLVDLGYALLDPRVRNA
jgi:ABC-type dipeptide/oligopeptide/nickel transport system permease component